MLSIVNLFKAKRTFASLVMISVASLFVTACNKQTEPEVSINDIKPHPTVVLKVGYDNKRGESLDLGFQHWKELLEERSNGTMTLELYPETSLGNQGELLRMIDAGDPVCTIADGATFYGRGAVDFGIVFGPYLFKNWEETRRLADSEWYAEQSEKLAKDTGLRIVSAKWNYGVRHLLTRKPVTNIKDFQGLKVRVPGNLIQQKGIAVFGATPVVMQFAQVPQALRNKEIDGLENVVNFLYGGGFYKDAPYLLLTGHVYNFTNLVVSEKWWQSLNSAEQNILLETCERAAKYFNVVNQAEEYNSLRKLKEAGVTITEPSPQLLGALIGRSHSFYVLKDFRDWSPGLYYKILTEKSIPWSYYSTGKLTKAADWEDK